MYRNDVLAMGCWLLVVGCWCCLVSKKIKNIYLDLLCQAKKADCRNLTFTVLAIMMCKKFKNACSLHLHV